MNMPLQRTVQYGGLAGAAAGLVRTTRSAYALTDSCSHIASSLGLQLHLAGKAMQGGK